MHCDLKTDVEEVEWYWNCTHPKQQAIVISVKHPPPGFSVTQNSSTKSFDLRIDNITEDDPGLYYCIGYKIKGEKTRGVTGSKFKLFFEGK